MGKVRAVLRFGGLTGLLAGVLLILVVGAAVALLVGEGSPGGLSYFGFFELLPGGLVLAIAILAIPLFLALYLALREASPVFPPFGSAWGILGLLLLGLSFAYRLGWEIIIGLLFIAVSFMALGAVMGGSPDSEDGLGGTSVVLGLAMFLAALYSIDTAIGVIAALLILGIFLILFGWKVSGLSKGLTGREDVTKTPKAWTTQPGAIRGLTVSLLLVGSFYIAFTVYVFLLEVVWAGLPPQGSPGYWNVGYPLLVLTTFGVTYIAVALTLQQRTMDAWQQALVASGIASGISVLLSVWWLGFIGSFWVIPLAFAVPSLALYALAPAVPAFLIGARRHFGMGVGAA